MRNLKRALSLTLASVMLLGMMVIGTSAAPYADQDQITNVTAATVLKDLKVMVGDGTTFGPDTTVTRGQMAIIICKIMYGNRLNVDTLAKEQKFDDVPAGSYFAGYVNFAAAQGIISGYGDGKFGPGDPVSTAQASLMLCRALGYFQAGELKGHSWAENALTAMTLATKLKLFGNLRMDTNAELSRDNVAEMVFNTMTKAVPVMYNETWKVYYTDSRNVMNGTTFNYMNSWAYENYNLVYKETVDDFGNKVITWGTGTATSYDTNTDELKGVAIAKKDEIITVEQGNTVIYTAEKKAADVERDLKGYTTKSTGIPVVVNGKTTSTTYSSISAVATAVAGFTKNSDGLTVKVYTDDRGDVSSISVVKEELAKVTSVNNSKKEITILTNANGNFTIKEKDDAYENLDGKVAVGDYILAVVDASNPDSKSLTNAYVGESVSGIVTAFTNKKALTIDGKEYKASKLDSIGGDTITRALDSQAYRNLDDECVVYLTTSGYWLAVDRTRAVTGEDVCFVVNKDDVGGFGSDIRVYVYLPDGTKGAYKLVSLNGRTDNLKSVATGLYTYTLNDSGIRLRNQGYNNASEFNVVNATNSVTINHSTQKYNVASGTDVYLNADTKFYVYNTAEGNIADKTDASETGLIDVSKGLSSIKNSQVFAPGSKYTPSWANGAEQTADTTFQVAYRNVNGSKIAVAVYAINVASDRVSASSADLIFLTGTNWKTLNDETFSADVIFTGEDRIREGIVIDGETTAYSVGLYTYTTETKNGETVYSLTRANNANCAFEGGLVKVGNDLLEVGGKELHKLNADKVVVIDNMNDQAVVDPIVLDDQTKTYYGFAVVDNTTDNNVLAVYITRELNAVEAPSNSEIMSAGGASTTLSGTRITQEIEADGDTITVKKGNSASQIVKEEKFLGLPLKTDGGGDYWVTHDNYVIIRVDAPAGITPSIGGHKVSNGDGWNGGTLDGNYFMYLVVNYNDADRGTTKTFTIKWSENGSATAAESTVRVVLLAAPAPAPGT